MTFNAITKSAVTDRDGPSARARRGSDRRLPRPPRARLSGRLHAVADPVAQAPGRQVGRAGAVGRAAADRRPRARDRAVQEPRNIGRSARPSKPTASRSPRGWSQLDGKKLDRLSIGNKGDADAAKAVVEAGPLHRRVGRDQAVRPQPAAAVHHLDPAAGSGAQARLLGQPHDARRPVALRGRADHLHAHRRRRHGARSGQRRAPGDRRAATTPATCPTSRATTPARSRTRRKRTRRSARPTFARPMPRAATMRGSTAWSTTARWPARWRRRGSSARPSS